MSNVGYATLQVIPSVRGIADELRRQLVGPAGDAGDRAGQSAGGGFRDAFTGALAALGVTEIASKIGEQFTEAFDQALEQSNISGILKGQLGATSAQAARYGKVAGSLYAGAVTDDLETAAEAVKATLQGGLVPADATKKQLREIATEMSDVSKTFGTDLSLQSQAVSAQLKNGLAPNAKAALDVITTGFQKLGPNAEDLLETFQEYPIQLKKLGLDSKTALGLFSQGLKGGARDTDIVADALKEFSIRSIDMSAGSQTAYKQLGLDASKMSGQIAKGGASATAGLQTVLDKLRGIHDPVKREAAAVGLFGTQAEELGTSLFKLDPSKAVNAIGKTSGAAKQLGKDLRSGPAYQITLFKRTVQQGLVTFLGSKVIPVLGKWGGLFNEKVLPPLAKVGGVLSADFVPAVKGAAGVVAGTVRWFKEWGIWLTPLAVLIGGITLALSAQAIVEAAVIGVMSAYALASRGIALVTEGWAAAQALLNAVMAINPFVLVAIAVVALGAALVIAWKKSETFRDIVMGAWAGIKTAAMAVWTGALKPVIDALVIGWKAVAAGAMWLWTTVLKPVFGFLATVAKVVATVFAVVFVLAFKVWWTATKLYIEAVAAVAMWLWKNVFSPVVTGIVWLIGLLWSGAQVIFGYFMGGLRALGAVGMWLWKNIFAPVVTGIVLLAGLLWTGVEIVFGYFMGGLKTVGRWGLWLYDTALKPAFAAIVLAAGLLWTGVKIVFDFFIGGLKTLGRWGTWLWKTAITPAINGVKTVISTVYNTGIKPVIDGFMNLIHGLGGAFKDAVGAIKTQWGKVEAIAKAPVKYVVDVVYNRGIVGTWNGIAGAFGAPKLKTYKFATGGPVFGAGTETSDSVPAWLSNDEHVWTAKEVRGAGGHGAVMALRSWAASGGFRSGTPGFASGGGLFGWVKSATSRGVDLAKSGLSWLKDGMKASAVAGLNAVVRPLIAKISGSASAYKDMITGIPERMIKEIVGYSGKADKALAAAGIGGKGYKAGLAWARTQNGKAYQWGGNGNPSWDCSGLVSAIESVIRGESPHRRWATGAFNGSSAPAGWTLNARSPYMIGITNSGVGHTAGTINGVNVESRGGDGVVIGNRARSYRDSLFTHHYGFTAKGYASGTKGASKGWAWVGELGPELVNFGGGETVLNHADSLRAALSMGAVGGYAKGTTAAAKKAARGDLPGDLAAWTKSLSGSAADIKAAAAALVKDLKTVGGAGTRLAKSTSATAAKLQVLAAKSQKITDTITAAKAFAADQKSTAADFTSLSQQTDVTSIGALISGLSGRITDEKATQSQISSLSKRGASKGLISQLIGLGPGSDLTALVAQASTADLKTLNALVSSGASLSTSYGNTMADLMFDAGDQAGKGFLAGLKAQEKALDAQMAHLGNVLVTSIKKKLQIKSPSRRTRWVGEMTGAGVEVGLDTTAQRVAAAAARVADAATPEVPAVSPAGITAASARAGGSAFGAGQAVTLVVQDGPTLRAYVAGVADGQVDDALDTVRRSLANRT